MCSVTKAAWLKMCCVSMGSRVEAADRKSVV